MTENRTKQIEEYRFRDLHPQVFIGTASDRYAGWVGQIYSSLRYGGKISARSKTLGGKVFKEEVVPVESVQEFFEHFSVLEMDFTFYRPLLGNESEPTTNYRVLQTYRKYLRENDRVILKVPQLIFAQRLRKGSTFVENPDYLNPDIFTRQFYEPARAILNDCISGFIFEQEYQPKRDRKSPEEYADMLDKFIQKIPRDDRYHMEVRTESLLSPSYFRVLEKHGIGQVLSHWTWLPPLRKQFLKNHGRFSNSGRQCIIRLMTPLGMRYEEAYAKAYPFNRMIEGMMTPGMIEDTVELLTRGIEHGVGMNVVINNRAGGNAPMIAQKISERLLQLGSPRV
jgi:uncharacterized protein YecE (DUF72 family)